MLFLQGFQIYTPFRRQKILQRLKQKYPKIRSVEATYGYFVECERSLCSEERKQLRCLLSNARFTYPRFSKEFSCWVLPRLGTVSSWSSNATEIARNCCMPFVTRIERGIFYRLFGISREESEQNFQIALELYDPLIESVLFSTDALTRIFQRPPLLNCSYVNLLEKGKIALLQANQLLGLSLSDKEIQYLSKSFRQLNRNPTDVELMMFAQINSEHCRHKTFNATWRIDGKLEEESLFSMVRYTHRINPRQVLVAYRDNAAVVKSSTSHILEINSTTRFYEKIRKHLCKVLKVETHNHPTAVLPFSGAATGSGGEIRDEMATGRGGQSQAGMTGFSVSHLRIPGFSQPWEKKDFKKKSKLSSPLEIILRGPVGAASFNNEFGRPTICGYFRTLECEGNFFPKTDEEKVSYGYHKPIMISGGIGQIYRSQVEKKSFKKNTFLVVIGGPAMPIGLGGGLAASRASIVESLDFASVQRANPEMQRRTQELINGCVALGKKNPILSIHDVGAGGLSNAFPELVRTSGCGGEIELRDIPIDAPGMTPLEIWCNEAQERFVLAIRPKALKTFCSIAERERCPFAIVGYAKPKKELVVNDNHFHNCPVDVPLTLLFDTVPPIQRKDRQRSFCNFFPLDVAHLNLADIVKRILQYPTVADKSFLITIGDRSVGGKIARDQMVGPWQVPVADVGVATNSFFGYQGQALAIGERAPVAMVDSVASARIAIGEAITNIAAAPIEKISQIVLSANWMVAENFPGEGANLYESVRAVTKEFCPALGICIPVGKDSLSMRTSWKEGNCTKNVISPLSLIVTATAPVLDVRYTLTPQLKIDMETRLLLIDLGKGAHPLGGSCLTQVYDGIGGKPPDVDDPYLLRNFFQAIQMLNRRKLLLAYHDRSDGGLLTTLCEMAFSAHIGITIEIHSLGKNPIASVFTESLGSVIQVRKENVVSVLKILEKYRLKMHTHVIGKLNKSDAFILNYRGKSIFQENRTVLHRWWSETSYKLQKLRDNPICAKQQYDKLLDKDNPELTILSSFYNGREKKNSFPHIGTGVRPRVAILREQGSNGHREMAAAFYFAGFNSVDIHMSDLLKNNCIDLKTFNGLVACGGFSFGDVLGAGRGWAQSILMHPRISDAFALFFQNKNCFSLGVCNGCQLFSHLKSIIPGAEDWPVFERNVSEQFEARLSLVEIPESPSLFFQGMEGGRLPIVVSHGEGRAVFEMGREERVTEKKLITMRYINSHGIPTKNYPENPNGSPFGITGLTVPDGRITILMPHPERVFRTIQFSWHPKEWGAMSPWMYMFYNARTWLN
ncbi:phosphoribosylformylglycinamidine synthase [Coxiella endosymbiont of Amblyomma sculptum]|uniref:phosphoribosylformylglycinamidine synthase n=1 Tax=Coxiella endosymbiont of Amblyomma sculptum TaxID=2487929 RepID=UPI00132E90FB|nr:phosphoribosylformylglycinamidine synthase [Coxiella endosymbiont of Amblyomma sculptum]QHG92346.1 phosphoribosylformylglycinamidine synthase [Coxiella endosymbiont of Amblyomma sculptum]